MATHSSVLAWRIPGMGEPGGLPSMGSYRVRHDWSDLAAAEAVSMEGEGSSSHYLCDFLQVLSFPFHEINKYLSNSILRAGTWDLFNVVVYSYKFPSKHCLSASPKFWYIIVWGFPDSSAGKESSCNAGDLGLIPGLGRSPGEGNGYPLQYPGLENSMDYLVHGVAKSWTWLSDKHTKSWELCGYDYWAFYVIL